MKGKFGTSEPSERTKKLFAAIKAARESSPNGRLDGRAEKKIRIG